MTAEPLERALDHERRLIRPTPLPESWPPLLRTARESDLPELRRLDEEVFQEVAHPAFLLRRHGLGRELMLEVLARLRDSGIELVRLTVEPANRAAILLYRSLGFSPEQPDAGLRRNYFGPGHDRLIMRLELTGFH